MSYSYSNPYAQPQTQSHSRPSFTTTSTSEPCQILFGGLPTDASENDLRVSRSEYVWNGAEDIGITRQSDVGTLAPFLLCQRTV